MGSLKDKFIYLILRFSAFALDLLLVGGISITFAYYLADDKIPFPLHFTLCFAAICAFCEGGPWQATPGKKILGLKVVGKNNESLHILNSFLRRLTWLVGFAPIIVTMFFALQYQYLLGLIGASLFLFSVAIFDKKNRSLPDMISGNVVVKYRANVLSKSMAFAIILCFCAYGIYVYDKTEGEIEMAVNEVKKLKNVGAIKAGALVFASQFIDIDIEEVVQESKSEAPPEEASGFTVATAANIDDRVYVEFSAVDPYEVGLYINRNLIHHRRYGAAPRKHIIDLKPYLRFGNNFIAVRAKVAGRIKTSDQIRAIVKTNNFKARVWREYYNTGKKEPLTLLMGPGPKVEDGLWNYKAKRFVIEEEVDLSTRKYLADVEGSTAGRKVSSLAVDNTQFGTSRFKKFFFGSWRGKKYSETGYYTEDEARMELKVTENEFEYSIGKADAKKFVYNSKNTGPGVYDVNIYSGTVRESMKITRRGKEIKIRRQNGDIYILSRSD